MWEEKDNKLIRSFEFSDFIEAFGFMTQVAMQSEKSSHHPWWSNVYNKVTIHLNTHDAGDIVTKKDYDLAASIDHIYKRFSR